MRQEARRERLEAAAAKAARESDARLERAHKMLDMIPPGQPILVGHYSERGHRAHLRKIDANFAKGFEADKRAKHLQARADAVGTAGISSDDPEAIEKLRVELAELEAAQAARKEINAAHKRFLKDPATLETAKLTDAQKERVRSYKPQYSWEPHPCPPYAMQNANANIRRIKGRIEQIEAARVLAGRKPETEQHGEITLARDIEDNRIRLLFPGKPDEATRTLLKANGFRWSPMAKAWQRQLNTAGEWAAERVLKALAAEAQQVA